MIERLALSEARARVAEQTSVHLSVCEIDWTQPGREALLVAGLLGRADDLGDRDALQASALALLGYQAHLDYEAGRAAALAGPAADAIVKPGDRIQDMEQLHRFGGTVRILRVDRIGTKDGKPAAVCSSANGDKATIRLDRIHRKNIKSGWRVIDAEVRP